MQQLENELLRLEIAEDGQRISLTDLQRGVRWDLDTTRWGYVERSAVGSVASSPLTPFAAGHCIRLSEGELLTEYAVPGGQVRFTWRLLDDGLQVDLDVSSAALARVSHPGSFVAHDPLGPRPGALRVLVPRNQGLLLLNRGPSYQYRYPVGTGIMLSMCGYLAERAALLAVQEDIQEKHLLFGKDDEGVFALFDVTPCAVQGWYARSLRLYPTAPSITAICKRHRQRLMERGQFVSWETKVARKPILDRLFGALIAFVGYNRGRSTDYAAAAQRLAAHGFDSVFYYPVRFNAMVLDFLMGGDAPIWLADDELEAMQRTGGVVAPWAWTYEALDDATERVRHAFRHDALGNPIPHWRIDQYTWYRVCTPYQADFVREQYQGPMQAMGWTHYDVNAIRGGEACLNRSHERHHHQPLTARQDQRAIAELLGPELNGNRVVSSEGFNEFFTPYYDLGSNKYLPAWGEAACIPVPMTMLVFHDSTVHNWWELHTYNEIPFGGPQSDGLALQGSGCAEKKAAMDALYGCPPLVFPFGRQYGWEDRKTFKTFSFEIALEDPEVQRALAAALPVARLHRQVGRQEMLSFEPVTDDYAVQTALFADGTRVVANISDEDRDAQGYGLLVANSWKALDTGRA